MECAELPYREAAYLYEQEQQLLLSSSHVPE
jgi:hypothetical protein